jgi:hypothetical protein
MSAEEGMLDDREDDWSTIHETGRTNKAYLEVDVADNEEGRQSLWYEINIVRGFGDTRRLLLADTWS